MRGQGCSFGCDDLIAGTPKPTAMAAALAVCWQAGEIIWLKFEGVRITEIASKLLSGRRRYIG